MRIDAPPELAEAASRLGAVLGTSSGTGKPNVFVLAVEDGASGATLTATRGPANDAPVTFRLAGSLAAVRAAAETLAADPAAVRFHYTARFDDTGKVTG